MPYIGNTIRAADDYRLIDDISSSFNGSTTSFALQVAGSAPVPFPKSPQQVLISVNGVIQEPDPTGASGFNLVGTNIVFSSAPTNGHAFFGIIYATADYLNSGGNFPTGSLGAPSITFVGDEDTGIYRKGSGSIGFVSNSTEIANTDSNGITISSGNLILGDSSGASDDRIKLGASGDLEIFHNGTDSRITNSTGDLSIRGNSLKLASTTGEEYFRATANGSVDLFYDNVVKLTTNSDGYRSNDNVKAQFGNSSDLNIYHNGTHSFVQDSGTGNLMLAASAFQVTNAAVSETMIYAASDGAVELYHDNSKKFETTSTGADVTGRLTTDGVFIGDGGNNDTSLSIGASNDLRLYHDGSNSYILERGTGNLQIQSANTIEIESDTGEKCARFHPDGEVQLYHDNSVKFATTSSGADVTGTLVSTGITVNGATTPAVINHTGGNALELVRSGKTLAFNANFGAANTHSAINISTGMELRFQINAANKIKMTSAGDWVPTTDNARNLGASSLRWANIYTTDLKLSNEGSQNDVDATWGNYTIQEGHEDLFLINHRTGKKFKFNLTEVA